MEQKNLADVVYYTRLPTSAKLSHEDFWFYIVKRMNWDDAATGLSHPSLENIGKKEGGEVSGKKLFHTTFVLYVHKSFPLKKGPFDFRGCKKDWTAAAAAAKEHRMSIQNASQIEEY